MNINTIFYHLGLDYGNYTKLSINHEINISLIFGGKFFKLDKKEKKFTQNKSNTIFSGEIIFIENNHPNECFIVIKTLEDLIFSIILSRNELNKLNLSVGDYLIGYGYLYIEDMAFNSHLEFIEGIYSNYKITQIFKAVSIYSWNKEDDLKTYVENNNDLWLIEEEMNEFQEINIKNHDDYLLILDNNEMKDKYVERSYQD